MQNMLNFSLGYPSHLTNFKMFDHGCWFGKKSFECLDIHFYIMQMISYANSKPKHFHGDGGEGALKTPESPEGGREGGEKKCAQRAHGGQGSNPGPTAC